MTPEKPGFFANNKDLILVTALGLLVVGIYFQVTGFSYVNLDDNLYVYGNEHITTGLNWNTVKWAFESYWAANWHPLTWLSHALDVQLFGVDPGMHHAVNVLIHLVNSILAFLVFRSLTGREWESFIVAALFAVHPTHVESVAWVAERKDVLSTMFWLLTMLVYVRYVRRQEQSEVDGSASWYARFASTDYILIVVFFALGLMAKPMLVTLPFVLLLCDLWPLKRFRSARSLIGSTLEKVPLFVLSAISSVVTVWAQTSVGAVQSLEHLTIATRLTNAMVSYAKYVFMLFYPADLAVLYPLDGNIPSSQIVGAAILLGAITAVCIWQIKRRPFLLFGWLWFLGTLVPVIGLVQVGSQALADRYTYVPYFGLFVMIVWTASSFVGERGFGKHAAATAATAAILAFSGLAWKQTSYWRDNESLYRNAIAITGRNGLVSLNLCHHLMLQDRLDEAEPLCRDALEINPGNAEAHNSLGVVQFKRSQFVEAEKSFKETLKYSPDYTFAWVNLAQAQSRQGKPADAEQSVRTAVELSGGAADQIFASALSDIANVYAEQHNYEKAVENYNRLLYLRPEDTTARTGLAASLYALKRFDDAQQQAEAALSIKVDIPEAWNTLGLVFLEKGQPKEAAAAFRRVIQLKPDHSEAKTNLERAERSS